MSKLILKAVFTYRFEHEVDKEFKNSLEADEYFKKNNRYFEDRLMEELPVNPININNLTNYDMIGAYTDYSKYIGALGRFFNNHRKYIVIDKLEDFYTDEGGKITFMSENICGEYDNFEPLTEEEIKALKL